MILPPGGTKPSFENLRQNQFSSDCKIRLLLSAPDSAHLVLTEAEHGNNITLTDTPETAIDVERSLDLIQPLLSHESIEVRTFVAPRFNTILRFDNEMLATIHLYGQTSDEAPLLHLQRHSDHGLFQQLTNHYDTLWQDAHPINASSTADSISRQVPPLNSTAPNRDAGDAQI